MDRLRAAREHDRRVRFTAALVNPRTGYVVWYGIEEGGEFAQDDPDDALSDDRPLDGGDAEPEEADGDPEGPVKRDS